MEGIYNEVSPIINLNEMSEQLDSATNCLEHYAKMLKGNKELCDKLLEENSVQSLEYMEFLTMLNSQYVKVWEETQVFLNLLSALTVCAVGGNHSEADKLKHDVFKKTAWIGCDRIGDSLFVKLPWLPLKKHYRSTLYQDELRYELELLSTRKEFPVIPYKRIHFVSVYKSDTSPYKIPDNDNYDTKRIIDILTDYIGGGDGGLVCSIYMETILNDEIPEGAYIIVSPKSTEFKNGEAHIDEFKRLIEVIKNDL